MNVFGPESTRIRKQCIWSHYFRVFLAAFPSKTLSYTSAAMPLISLINCKIEEKTEAYAFPPSMFSESSSDGNQSVFKDLNVLQIRIDKTNNQWNNWLTIWWGDQKTEVQVLGIQVIEVRINQPYD